MSAFLGLAAEKQTMHSGYKAKSPADTGLLNWSSLSEYYETIYPFVR